MPLLDVAHEGVVGPGVPESRHHVVELARAAVALAVLHVLVEPEVERRVRVGGGDDVPAGTAAAEMVERGEAARDVIGSVERGRAGGDQADALGDLRQRREQRERLERGHRVAALERLDRHVEHRHVVGHEEGVELAVLKLLREALEVGEVEIGVREGARIAPGAGMQARRPHEGAELELTRCWHDGSSARSAPGLDSKRRQRPEAGCDGRRQPVPTAQPDLSAGGNLCRSVKKSGQGSCLSTSRRWRRLSILK